MRTRLLEMGAEPITTTRAQANAFLDEEIVRWGKVVKSSNAQAD
jgi:tripartite-type tricarboxylate transporter receptor subunit TctC